MAINGGDPVQIFMFIAGIAGAALAIARKAAKSRKGNYTIVEKRGENTMRQKGNLNLSSIGVGLFVGCLAAGIAGTAMLVPKDGVPATPGILAPLLTGAIIGIYLLFAIRVADQWEKVAVLRLGKYIGLRGPGAFHMIPVIDSVGAFIDQRVRVTSVAAESTLTRDTVPVNVDANIFWLVWNVEKSTLEVQNYADAITLSAQTALRESIGRHHLAQMITERESMGAELQRILDEKTNPWGITVQSVEIRDVQIPKGLEDAMSREAQAERERRARCILGQAEAEIADSFAQAAKTYHNDPVALHLRAMNMLYEAIKERGSTVIIPSSVVETMGMGGMLATANMAAPAAIPAMKPEVP